MSKSDPVVLIKGNTYRIVYQVQSGNYRWYKYEAIMTFLGSKKTGSFVDTPAIMLFSLRPFAGTQELRLSSIWEAESLGKTAGRNDYRHRSPKSLGSIPKEEVINQ